MHSKATPAKLLLVCLSSELQKEYFMGKHTHQNNKNASKCNPTDVYCTKKYKSQAGQGDNLFSLHTIRTLAGSTGRSYDKGKT